MVETFASCENGAVTLRIGMAQMLVRGAMPEENLARATAMIERAAAQGCRVVVLPECLDFGWTDPSARDRAEPIPGKHSDQLAQAARSHSIWVTAGLVEREGERLYNTAVLISPEGEIVLKHRKINELALAHDLYSLGTEISVADTELGRVGLAICADNYPDSPEIGGALGRMGCRLLLSPCAWAVDADHNNAIRPYGKFWRESYPSLTTKFPMTVIGVSSVGAITSGPWKGRKCVGCSLAYGPGGIELAQAPPDEEALLVVEADIADGRSSVSPTAAAFVSPAAKDR
jgi:predicted amidohydrolase